MSLWSIHNKPKYLSATDLANTAATSSGWVLTKNNHTETLVAIGKLSTKQIPVISSVTTNKTAYVVGTDSTIVFTVTYNYPITTDITNATTLDFSLGEEPLTAAYSDKTANTLEFTYTFPTTSVELTAILAAGATVSSLSVGDITLDGVEKISLDNENYVDADVIAVSLVTPSSLAIVSSSASTPAHPAITSIVAGDGEQSYVLGTDATIVFTVNYDTEIFTDITSASTLKINFGELSNGLATYTSKTADTLVFTYTFANDDTELLAGTSSTTMTFGNITLGASKVIHKLNSRIDASLVVPTTPINVTISRP